MKWYTTARSVGLALILLSVPTFSVQAQEQHSRFTVLVPDLRSAEFDKKFGENVAKELRKLLDNLATHQSIPEKDLKSALKQYKLDGSNLDCTQTRQLASLIGSQLALCGSVEQESGQWVLHAAFVDIGTGESFRVSPATVQPGGVEAAAMHVFQEFDSYTTQLRAATFCADYATSRAWVQAMEQCDRALTLNPESITSRYYRARVLYETERHQEALAELETVLEANMVHEDALQLAGYISALVGEEEAALQYYSRYLELSPTNAAVRMKIAYELAQAGDPAGAMQLVQKGLDYDAENVDLWEQLGGFAFAAGQRINESSQAEGQDANTLAPGAVSYFRTAIEAYLKVYEAKGPETPATELRSILAAFMQLGEAEAAVTMGDRFLKTHADEAGLWSVYADALQRGGKLAEALTALDRVKELDPAYPNVALRQGKWLLEAGRMADAVAALKALAASEPGQADAAGRMVVAQAYAKGVQPKNWTVAVQTLEVARAIPGLSTETNHQINFWLGYSILQGAIPDQEARTVETAQATLPRFIRARELFGQVGDYPSKVNVNLTTLMEAVNQYIEIQESIIKRG